MRTFKVAAPDGNIYTVTAPDTATDEELIATVRQHLGDVEAPAPQATQGKAGFLESAITTGKSMLSQSRTGMEALGGDPTAAAQAGLARQESLAPDAQRMASFDDVKQAYKDKGLMGAASQVVSSLPSALGQITPSIAQTAAGARAGAMLGAPFTGVSPAIPLATGLAGAFFPNVLLQYGANQETQVQAQKDRGETPHVDTLAAASAAAAQAGLDFIGFSKLLGSHTVSRLLSGVKSKADVEKQLVESALKSTTKEAGRSLPGAVGAGAARGTVEVPTEIGQQILQRWQAGQSLTDEDALNEYQQAAYLAAVGGPAAGGIAGPVERASARRQLSDAGLDARTGQPARPDISPNRLAQLEAEQRPTHVAAEDRAERMAERQMQVQAQTQAERDIRAEYRQAPDLLRTDDVIQAEIDSLRTQGLEGRDRDRRIRILEAELAKRNKQRELPEDEAARRAQANARDLASTPPAARAADSAVTLLRGTFATVDSAVLRSERESLRADTTMPAAERQRVLQAMNEELRARDAAQAQADAQAREVAALRAQDSRARAQDQEAVRAQLPAALRADVAAEAFTPPVITPDLLTKAGLRKQSALYKRLEGLDLSKEPGQREAARALRDAQRNTLLNAATKQALTDILSPARFDAVRAAADPARHGLTPETARTDRIDEGVFDALGITEKSPLVKSGELQGLDLSNPEHRQHAVSLLDSYAQGKQLSPETAQRIQTYAKRLRDATDLTFKTARGSSYQVHADGTTTRNKAARDDAGHEGDSGSKPRTAKTVYVDGNAADLSAAGLSNLGEKGARVVLKDGKATLLTWNDHAGRWGASPSGRNIPFYSEPAVGRFPLELWKPASDAPAGYEGYRGMHAGNQITEISTNQQAATGDDAGARVATARPAPAVQGLTDETLNALGIGRTAKLRGDTVARALDPAHPGERAQLMDIMGKYAQGRSAGIQERVGKYLDQLRAMDQEVGNGRPDTTTNLPVGGADAGAGVPGMGVAGPGSPSAQRSDTTHANRTQVPGQHRLDDVGRGTEQPARAVEPADGALTPEVTVSSDGTAEQASALTPEQQALIDQDNKDVVDVAGFSYEARTVAGDLAGSVTPELTSALEAQDVSAALNIIREGGAGFNQIESFIADRILGVGQELPTLQVVDALPAKPNGSRPAGQYNAVTDTISLVRGQADSHTFLHEVVHAFTHRFIERQGQKGVSDPHVKELLDLFAHVKRMLPNSDAYGLSNLSEFVAESMSNPDFQMQLMGIPYRKQTIWSSFTAALRKLMGMPLDNPVDNALFAAVVHTDGLMNPGRGMQVDERGMPVMNPVVSAVRTVLAPPGGLSPQDFHDIQMAPSQQQRSALKAFLLNFQSSANGPSRMTKIRVQSVDQFASLAERLDGLYNQGLRDAFGEVNPLNFLRQAVDYKRVSLMVYRLGGLRKDPETGMYEAVPLKDGAGKAVSPAVAIQQIKAMADKYGMSYEDTSARISTVLEGMRLKELREFNNSQEAIAQAYETLGTKAGDDLADKARDKKKRLHMLNAEIDDLVQVYEQSPEIQQIQNTLNYTRANLIDNLVDAGRLTPETGEFWKDNIHYIPFDRLTEVLETTTLTQSRSHTGIGQLGALPALDGSYVRPVVNGIKSYMDTLAWMVGQTMRNNGFKHVMNAMERAGYATRVATRDAARNKDLVAPPVYVDGKPVLYELQSEADLAAFSQSSSPDGALINGLAFTSRLLRGTITAMPTFSLNQVMQDTFGRAGLLSGVESLTGVSGRTFMNFPKTVFNEMRGKESEAGSKLHGFGIVGNFDYNEVNPLQTLEYELGAVRQNTVARTLYRLEQIAKASDQAVREAIYQQTMLETGDKALALVRAREVINYGRKGASRAAQIMVKTVPFFNAYAQGLDLMYRGTKGVDTPSGLAKGRARAFFAGRVALYMGIGFAYALGMSDDDDYKNATDYVRDRGFIIPRALSQAFDGADGRHTPLVIPTPREYAFFSKMIPERLVQYYKEAAAGEAGPALDVVTGILGSAANSYLMAPIPPGIKQVIEYGTNYSFFTGEPLVGAVMAQADPYLQYKADTSDLARKIGSTFNLSPIKVENALKGMLGTAGALALTVADMATRQAMPQLPMDKIPGLSTFTTSQTGSRLTSEFYQMRDKYLQAQTSLNILKDDPQRHAQFLAENAAVLSLKGWMNEKTKALRTIRSLRSIYMRNENLDMTPAQRRAELRRLDKVQEQLLADVPKMRGIITGIRK